MSEESAATTTAKAESEALNNVSQTQPQSSNAMTYFIIGPESSGKRTLSKILEFSNHYDFSVLSDSRKHFLRLCVQVSAAETLLQATHGQRHTPKDVENELKQVLEKSCGVEGLLSDPELEESFLRVASQFAKDTVVKKLCARPGNIVNLDKSKAFFLKPEDIFTKEFVPSKLDVINAREPVSGLQDPQDIAVRVNDSDNDTFSVTTIPASWWTASLRGNDKLKLFDSLCQEKKPFSTVIMVPLDDYSFDENGHGTSLEDDARRKHHEKKKERKSKVKLVEQTDQSESGEQAAFLTIDDQPPKDEPKMQRPHLSYVVPVFLTPRAPPASPANSSSSAMSSESSRSSSPYSGSSSPLPTDQQLTPSPLGSSMAPPPLLSSPIAPSPVVPSPIVPSPVAPSPIVPSPVAPSPIALPPCMPPSVSFPDNLCAPSVERVAETDSFLSSNAPPNVSSLLYRRQKSTTDLMVGKSPGRITRGRRSFMLSVDTTPMDSRARAVRVDDECETPSTCTAALSSIAPAPLLLSPATPKRINPDAPSLSSLSDMMGNVSLDDKAKRHRKRRSKPCVNKVTNGLKIIRRLAGQRVVQDAERVFIVFTRTDRFTAACPQVASISCCFPDYVAAGEESSQASGEYIVALYDAALRDVPAAKKQMLWCSLIDETQVNSSLLPSLLAVARNALEDRKVLIMRKQAEDKLRKEKQALGCVRAPETKEKMRLKLTSGQATEKGRRSKNEDSHSCEDDFRDEAFHGDDRLAYYAIFDGHNGTTVAENCAEIVHKQLLFHQEFPAKPEVFFKEGYAHADKLVTVADDKSGATAVTAIVFGNTLYVANVGDSECIVVSHDEDGSYKHSLMTVKHVLSDDSEKQRVTDMGGMVVCGRLFGTLAVSRAFGDSEFKEPGCEYVSIVPHVSTRELNRSDEMMIIACDGLWDRLSYDDAMQQAVSLRASGMNPTDISKALIRNALERGTMDNVTVIVVFFEWS